MSSTPSYSRQNALCGYCQQQVIRHNLPSHIKNKHGANLPIKERAIKMRTLSSMMPPKKIPRRDTDDDEAGRIEEAVDADKVVEPLQDIEPVDPIEPPETVEAPKIENKVMTKLEELESTVKLAMSEIKQDISDFKKVVTKDEVPNNDDTEYFEDNAVDNARTVSEICMILPEIKHINQYNTILCKLCINEKHTDISEETQLKTTGLFKYKYDETKERKRDEIMEREFRNLKKDIKRHLKTQTHKEHVLEIERESRFNKNRDDTRDNKAAALRCARICYGLYAKGRPFTDYPETVAAIVAGGTFMGETNHSKEFAASFLTSVATVVREKMQEYLKTPLTQTGFKPPVKIVADKDTIKHRTRQIIALTTFFPDAEELIQTLYVSHPLVKKHKGEDIADHLYDNLVQFLSSEQYQGGSYDGAYFHQSVPKYLGEKFGVNDEDVQNDHDWLHKCGICEKNVRNKTENDWATKSAKLCATSFKDFNWGKEYEELRQIAEDLDIDFKSPKFHSQTRFANSSSRVFNTFFTDLPAIIARYRAIKTENENSNIQKEKDKATHASNMLKKLDNKKFLLSQAGLCDIYSLFSSVVCDLQKVNQLPFERWDLFKKKLQILQKMTENLRDHSMCDQLNCSWPKLHYHKESISSGKLSNDVTITSDEPGTTIFSRSVARRLVQQSNVSYETGVYEHLSTYITTLYQELSTLFNIKDRECIELSRSVADWPSLAIKLKSRSVPILHIYEKVKFVESCRKIDRNLRSISKEDIEKQFKIFLQRLHNITQYRTYNDLEKSDPKEMIRYFMQHEHLYSGVELVMNATAVAAIKLSVESIAESYISIYNIHNSDIRAIKEETAEDEMMIHINGPAIGEADDTLKAALDKYFNGSQWHFSVEGNIFRSSGITVDKLLKKKSRLPFYKIKK